MLLVNLDSKRDEDFDAVMSQQYAVQTYIHNIAEVRRPV